MSFAEGGDVKAQIQAARDLGYANRGYISFKTRNGNMIERMRVTSDGRVGIGTTNPVAPLHVETSNSANYGNFTFYAKDQYTNHPNSPTSCCGGSVNAVSIHANGRVLATEFDAFSDARIKNVLGFSEGSKDLSTLMQVKITDYKMIDQARDQKDYKKVIAQQVESVYPQAVSKTTESVPDIYATTSIKNGHIELKTNLEVGERVKLIFPDKTIVAEVTSVEPNGFTVNKNRTGKVFVYGREVNDFRTVDYEAISMLNVSATQELYRLILDLQSSNEEMKKELSTYSSLSSEIERIKEAIGLDLQSSK